MWLLSQDHFGHRAYLKKANDAFIKDWCMTWLIVTLELTLVLVLWTGNSEYLGWFLGPYGETSSTNLNNSRLAGFLYPCGFLHIFLFVVHLIHAAECLSGHIGNRVWLKSYSLETVQLRGLRQISPGSFAGNCQTHSLIPWKSQSRAFFKESTPTVQSMLFQVFCE